MIALDLADHPSWLERLSFVDDEAQAARDADALVIVTEWKIFADFVALGRLWKSPVIFDGRNLYEPETMSEQGIEYHPIGRPARQPSPPCAGHRARQRVTRFPSLVTRRHVPEHPDRLPRERLPQPGSGTAVQVARRVARRARRSTRRACMATATASIR